MAIQPNMLLTAEIFDRARRRLGELPDHAVTRLAVKPEADGFATVDVVVLEIAAVPHGPVEWAGAVGRTVANREIDVSVPGVSGQGEVWSAGWRWWQQSARRQRRVRRAAVRTDGRGSGDSRARGSRTPTAAPLDSTIVESRTHGGLTVSDWLPHRLRYTVSTGLDAWSGGRKAASIGAGLEHQAFSDRLTLSIDATQWAPLAGGAAFRSAGARAIARSSAGTSGWVARGAIGVERVSDEAPIALWPGAGEGQVRAPLLRAHPLLNDGIIDLTPSSAFGRTLAFGSAEVQRWLEKPTLARLGLAAFTDVARASRQSVDRASPVQVDVGVGPSHQDSRDARGPARRRRARASRRRERADVRLALLERVVTAA